MRQMLFARELRRPLECFLYKEISSLISRKHAITLQRPLFRARHNHVCDDFFKISAVNATKEHRMRGFITDPASPGGLRLVNDLPEPEPAPDQFLLEVRAYSINSGEARLITQRPQGWRPGQDVAGIVRQAAANGSGPPEGTRVAARVDWEGWAERVAVPGRSAAVLDDRVSFEQAATLPIAGLTALRALRV